MLERMLHRGKQVGCRMLHRVIKTLGRMFHRGKYSNCGEEFKHHKRINYTRVCSTEVNAVGAISVTEPKNAP